MDSSFLDKAIAIARKCHAGQVDKAGKPYIEHCLRVMDAVSSLEEKIVGVLHDAVEDSDLTIEDLASEGFPVEIISAVEAISRREDERRSHYMKRIVENPIAIVVKLADITDNSNLSRLGEVTEKDRNRTEVYRRDIEKLKRIKLRQK
jgi:(p)ppGpp synthase/HD superfamily hydrolase